MGEIARRRSDARHRSPARLAGKTRTLAIDVGGTGIKALILDARGAPISDRVRVETPHPATPKRLLAAIWRLIEPLGPFDRMSVGFPGVVVDGVTKTAPNLHPSWKGYDLGRALARHSGRPVRVINDAGMQGYGVVEGRGVELVVTLGTGMGSSLFVDGKNVPNLDLAHHPFRKKKTYEEWVGAEALRTIGKRRWNKHLSQVLARIEPTFNPRRIYLGGGNAKHVSIRLSPHVELVANVAGLLGGIALWHDAPTPGRRSNSTRFRAVASRRRRSRPS